MRADQIHRVQAHAYMRGWEDGAAGLWHRGDTLTDLAVNKYADGYREGQKQRGNMRASTAAVFALDRDLFKAEEASLDQQKKGGEYRSAPQQGLDERSDIVGSGCLACGKELYLPVEVSGMAWCNFDCQDVWKKSQQKGLEG